ncbi:MAG: hypothetical protein P1V51_06870 [Deltaproteobacteria bacterium]|nr:hypothetical protein [Deltaproteobacteria bacterium]
MRRLSVLFGLVVFVAAPGLLRAEESAEEAPAEAKAEATQEDAVEQPPPWLWTSAGLGVSGFPSGLILDLKGQYRVPLWNSKSILFEETYAGAGMRLAITPAFIDVGPRLSFAPIAIFDVDVQAGYQLVWPSGSGLVPFPDLTVSKLETDRNPRHRDGTAPARSGAFGYLSVAPTLKVKVGPIIAFDAWDLTWFRVRPHSEETSDLLYEAYRDMIITRNDFGYEHQAAVVYEIFDGKGGPLLWVGATYRDRKMFGSGDRSMNVGALAIYKPFDSPIWPKLVVQVLPYLKYATESRIGGGPNTAFLLSWGHDFQLGWKSEVKETVAALRAF